MQHIRQVQAKAKAKARLEKKATLEKKALVKPEGYDGENDISHTDSLDQGPRTKRLKKAKEHNSRVPWVVRTSIYTTRKDFGAKRGRKTILKRRKRGVKQEIEFKIQEDTEDDTENYIVNGTEDDTDDKPKFETDNEIGSNKEKFFCNIGIKQLRKKTKVKRRAKKVAIIFSSSSEEDIGANHQKKRKRKQKSQKYQKRNKIKNNVSSETNLPDTEDCC